MPLSNVRESKLVGGVDQPEALGTFSPEDREYVLNDIAALSEYEREAAVLRGRLEQPISEGGFIGMLDFIVLSRPNDAGLQGVVDELARRFRQCWSNARGANAKVAEPTKVTDLIFRELDERRGR